MSIEPPARDVREHAARAQAEQRDRDRQKREVVVHHDREDARERTARSSAASPTRARRRRAGDRSAGRRTSWRESVPSSCGRSPARALRRARRRVVVVDGRAAARARGSRAGRHASIASAPSFALVVYAIGSAHLSSTAGALVLIWSAQMPVCARCAGIYLGAAAIGVAAVARHAAAAVGTRAPLRGRHSPHACPGCRRGASDGSDAGLRVDDGRRCRRTSIRAAAGVAARRRRWRGSSSRSG